jgi:hypothetical protein
MKYTAIVIAFTVTLAAAPARAQNAQSYVSGHGSDVGNTCTLATPCRTFAAASAVTKAGGEITVLDPAEYGTLTITQAINIVSYGVGAASVLVPTGGTGIIINARPSDDVTLRGLTIEGDGSFGIVFNTGRSLTIEDCVIRRMSQEGILFQPNATSDLRVSDTLVDGGLAGIDVSPSGGSGDVSAVLNRVEVGHTGWAAIGGNSTSSTGTVTIAVLDSIAVGNKSNGFYARSNNPNHAPITIMLSHVVAVGNGAAIAAEGQRATLRIASSVVTGNDWDRICGIPCGTILSAGDNTFEGNAHTSPALPRYSLQ